MVLKENITNTFNHYSTKRPLVRARTKFQLNIYDESLLKNFCERRVHKSVDVGSL